ncbi:MAG: hypothetical protein P8N09_01450 [Planctomycetota bacterium]|nr:hypothetical protein [Planctomycetota bacterium]
MKLPTTRLPKSKFGRLRPWILPIAFVITLFAIIDRPFDAEALREELRAGHTEDALRSLQGSQPGQLPLDIAAVNWWPHDARQQRIRSLRAHAAKDPDESLAYPTISSPLDAWRHPPTEFRLREPSEKDLILDIDSLDLGLPVAKLPIPSGTQHIPLTVLWVPGVSFVMSVREKETGQVIALAQFQLLAEPRAKELGRAMRTAYDLASGGANSGLLAAVVALNYGLYAEAIERLAAVIAEPDAPSETVTVARELRAIALAEQGLDITAVTSLDN